MNCACICSDTLHLTQIWRLWTNQRGKSIWALLNRVRIKKKGAERKMTSYAPTRVKAKSLLSVQQFEAICAKAATDSTDSQAYISGVLDELRGEVDDHNVSSDNESNYRNVQTLINSLYQLLEERYEFDFDLPFVLNSYAPR